MLTVELIDLLMAKRCDIAADLAPVGHVKRWIVVCPFQIDPLTGMSTISHPTANWFYRVRCFGLPEEFDQDNYDVHEEDLINYENVVVSSLEEVESVLSQWIDKNTEFKEGRLSTCPLC
mgnify:CR=1 FL=1